jgi:hypothetical protein
MKHYPKRLVLLLAIFGLMGTSMWGQGRWRRGNRGQNRAGVCQLAITNLPLQDLSVEEAEGLILMREEEKLARDVYRTLYAEWGLPIFANIAGSEQRHTDAIKVLIDRYALADPVTDDTVGVFSDAKFQALYEELVATGRESLTGAFRVGATIEDLDIHDLNGALAATDNSDIETVYLNLQKGSRNHLRAFVGQLESLGDSYSPQYLDPDSVEEILNSPWEAGIFGGGMGRGPRRGGPPNRSSGRPNGRP